jgi:hypothetical protein
LSALSILVAASFPGKRMLGWIYGAWRTPRLPHEN